MRKDIGPRPVNYSRPVTYSTTLTPIFPVYAPEGRTRVNGVYMLTEAGRFYIGQSLDVFRRLLDHLSNPACCGMTAPTGVLLAAVPFRDGWTWHRNAHTRLIAEARFIAAALSLDLPLTNKLSEYKRGKLLRLFPDLATERTIVEGAIRGN